MGNKALKADNEPEAPISPEELGNY